MSGQAQFGLIVLVLGLAGTAAVLSNRLSARLRVPAPAFFLVAASIAAQLWPTITALPVTTVERVVTVALAVILFDGGMHIGRRRFRTAAAARYVAGMNWHLALLVGTAVAATDPAVVFSVFGRREIAGRTGVLLEGESGANDPVGISLMVALLSVDGLNGGALAHVGTEFVLQMAVGAAVGIAGGGALLAFMRKVPLPSEALYPLRTAASALLVYGVASVAHGSGFLAVFVAGIVIGDAGAPYKREVERFHASLASLGEIVAFLVLGLTVDLTVISRANVWVPGLVLGLALAFVIRPLLIGVCLITTRLPRNERVFVLCAGLKGAVPVLLGSFVLSEAVPHAQRLYGIVVVAVVFSVVVQGSLIPAATRLLHLPVQTVDLEPWALGVRLQDEPDGVFRFSVVEHSGSDGRTIDELGEVLDGAWVSMVVRDGQILPLGGDAALRSGDDVLVLARPDRRAQLAAQFEVPVSGY